MVMTNLFHRLRTAEILASKIVPLLTYVLNNRLRNAHYYFDLRALTCVLVSADSLKCERHQTLRDKNWNI